MLNSCIYIFFVIVLGYLFPLPLVLGWLLDKLLADPVFLPHPVVGFGKLIAYSEHSLNVGKRKVLKGGIMAVCLIVSTFVISWIGLYLLYMISVWLHLLISIILIFYCLAGTTLIHEVCMVFKATDRSLDEGRKQVSRIVGRDTSDLSEQKIRSAALETLAENLSDGVIAPLFWYLLLGIPGMLCYKMVNTLDSMIGYKDERYIQFGRIAAKIDDAANYIPARLTALLMILVNGKWSLMTFVRKYGDQHTSPNSGYPEAALAGILNCRFGGPSSYFGKVVYKPYIGYLNKTLTTSDMQKAIRINQKTELVMVLMVLVIQLLVNLF